MLTSAIISMAKKEASDWSRVTLLTYLDELQKMVFSQNTTSQMRIYDSTTGADPLLTTTSSTYEYAINTTNGFPYNAWRVTAVYDDEDDIEDADRSILMFDATPSTAYARIVFPEAPSGKFYIRCYRFPTTLSSESIQLEVPSAYHLTHIFQGLLGLIEMSRSGSSKRWDNFIDKLLPDLKKRMSDAQSINYETPYRECGI